MRSLTIVSLLGALLAPQLQAQELFDRDLGTNLALGDDSTAQGLSLGFAFPFGGIDYSAVCVCSNGYIWLGATSVAGADYTPTDAELRSGAARICPLWGDYNPAAPGSGNVWMKTLPDRAVISWAGVYEYGTTNAVDFQVTLYPTGHFDIAYGSNPAAGGLFNTAMVIGASPGAGASANLVSFATRPMLTGGVTFAEVLTVPGAIAYHDTKWNFSPSAPGFAVSDLVFVPNDLPPPARFELVGTGCPSASITIYELYGNGIGSPLDIGGSELTFTPNSEGGYLVSRELPRPRPLGTASLLPAGDDTRHLVTLPFAFPHASGTINQIVVAANGFITLGPTDPGAGCCVGGVLPLLNGPPRIAAFWLDLNPAAGGTLSTSYDPIKGIFSVIWDRVPEHPSVGSNTFQISLEPSGVFRIHTQSIALATSASQSLVGYSDGNGSNDPGQTDLSAIATPLDLGARRDPLTLRAVGGGTPVLGSTFVVQVNNMVGVLAYLALGNETPPIDLAPIGAPGCVQLVALPEIMSLVNVVYGFPSTDFAIPIPLTLDLAGQQLMSQAASDDVNANALGWRVSNGARWTIGL